MLNFILKGDETVIFAVIINVRYGKNIFHQD